MTATSSHEFRKALSPTRRPSVFPFAYLASDRRVDPAEMVADSAEVLSVRLLEVAEVVRGRVHLCVIGYRIVVPRGFDHRPRDVLCRLDHLGVALADVGGLDE